jgi:3-oxoacyl-[acyl-carrier protein] reductase
VTDTAKAALITGGSRGIGAAIAIRLAADGFAVLVNYRTDEGAADHVVDVITSRGGRAVAARADVADPDQMRGLFDTALQRFGRLDVVVSNAGIGHSAPIAQTSDADFDAVFAINARATFVALREAARCLPDGGRIIVISRSTLRPRPGGGLYAASKAAGDALVVTAAQELGPRQITVNSVLPGATRTDMWTRRQHSRVQEERDREETAIADRTALRRLGEPEDIADVVAFLASPSARWITGQAIAVDGGLV